MAYQPLARKYRPATFSDLVGQSGVATALTNAIRLGREPHAVIFAGVRGIGKTTTARLYAKALDCVNGPTPEPCGVCESCKAIEFGSHEDVLEIDGASNTSVDDVRSLRETVSYVPQRSKFKIYIIDEVHMLSQSAFNALLKTLEEPPSHVVFVFATTELQKIPQTIMSRCQTFHLKKFSMEDLAARITAILRTEGLTFDEDAVQWVARQGRGSMRDALTALDQIIAFGDGQVTKESLERVVGAVSPSLYSDCLAAFLQKDAAQVYQSIELLVNSKVSVIEHVEELISLCRHAFVVKDLGAGALDVSQLGLDQEMLQKISELVSRAEALELNRLFRTLMKCRMDLDGSNLDRFVLENYMFEWCKDPGLPKLDDLRLILEQARHGLPVSIATQPAPASSPATSTASKPERRPLNLRKGLMGEIQARSVEAEPSKVVNSLVTETVVKPSLSKVLPETWRELVDAWKQSKPLQARILEEAYLITYSPREISVSVNENSLAAAKLLQPQVQNKVKDAFKEMFGFTGDFRVSARAGATTASTPETLHEESAKTENLLEIKAREKDLERQRLLDDATKNPTTQVVLDAFNAKIEKVTIDH